MVFHFCGLRAARDRIGEGTPSASDQEEEGKHHVQPITAALGICVTALLTSLTEPLLLVVVCIIGAKSETLSREIPNLSFYEA